MKIDWLGYMVQTYLSAEKTLYAMRDKEYPVYSVVRMVNGNVGVVMRNEDCPANKIPVRFENGNSWFKDLGEVACRIDNKKLWPKWARREVIMWRQSACSARQAWRVIKASSVALQESPSVPQSHSSIGN